MATPEERFTAIESNLNEAFTELNELIAALRAEIEANGLTPAALEKLASVESKAKALADIVNNTVPPAP